MIEHGRTEMIVSPHTQHEPNTTAGPHSQHNSRIGPVSKRFRRKLRDTDHYISWFKASGTVPLHYPPLLPEDCEPVTGDLFLFCNLIVEGSGRYRMWQWEDHQGRCGWYSLKIGCKRTFDRHGRDQVRVLTVTPSSETPSWVVPETVARKYPQLYRKRKVMQNLCNSELQDHSQHHYRRHK